MIYIERIIEIKRNEAKIEEPIILYKGDKNIELQFMIENNPFKYRSGVELTYGQLVIKRPNTDPIFSDVAKLSNSKVLFTVTGEMIDELVELGNYDFQIRLINADKTSRGTLPPVFAGIVIRMPVCEEEGVNYSVVNYSKAATGEVLDVFDDEGNYIKTEWSNGDLITDSKLNKIEGALYDINANHDEIDLSGYADKNHTHDEYITESELNAKGYLTEHQSLDGYATEQYVQDEISNAQLGGDGEVDLSGYATKEELDNKADWNHGHDDRYYPKYQMDTKINNCATKQYVDDMLDGYTTKQYVNDILGDIETLLGGI